MLIALPQEWYVEPPLDIGRVTLWLIGVIILVAVLVGVGVAATRDTAADRRRAAAAQKHLDALLAADRTRSALIQRRAEADAGRIDEITTELR